MTAPARPKRRRGMGAAGAALAAAMALFSTLAAPQVSRAQAPSPRTQIAPAFGLYVDQDVFWKPAFDQDYTMGVQFEWYGNRRLQGWLKAADYLVGVGPGLLHRAYRKGDGGGTGEMFYFGSNAFTPLKGVDGVILADTLPIYDDRPYASLLYVKAQRVSARGDNAISSDLTLGVLGLEVAKAVQTFIHEHVRDDVRPGGWPYQISQGGELTGKYHVSLRRRLLTVAFNPPADVDALTTWPGMELVGAMDGSVGYYTNATVGARLRVGWFDSPWWMWERTPIDPFLVADATSDSGDAGDTPVVVAEPEAEGGSSLKRLLPDAFFGFVSGGETHWWYNALLQGQWRRSEVTLDFDRGPAPMKRWASDVEVGVAARWGRTSVSYIVYRHSALFGGPNERTHSWAGIHITRNGVR